jgi:diacylglycerol kinase family enzyme
MELEAAAQVILNGREARIDTGCVNDRAFINNSSLGLYPRLVLYRENLERKGVPRWAALCSAAFYILSRYRTMHVEFEIEGRRTVRKTPLVFVGNSIYTLKGISAGSRESLCDGVLTVVIARQQSAWAFLKGMLKVLAGIVENNDSLEVLHLTSLTGRPRSRTAVVSTDGEVSVLEAPLKYSVRPGSLTVLTPKA